MFIFLFFMFIDIMAYSIKVFVYPFRLLISYCNAFSNRNSSFGYLIKTIKSL